MQRSEVIKFLILRTFGNFLVLFALAGITLTFGQALYQEGIYRLDKLRGVEYRVASDSQNADESGFGSLLDGSNIIVISPVDTEFGIVIPKINANSRVIPSVDPANYGEYMAALQIGVAHASGSAVPGENGNVYLFAHSTDYAWNVGRYNAVFYLLKEVEAGDEVDIFYRGRRFIYTVEEKKIVSPDEVGYIKDNYMGEQRLTLQTCWPPGTAIKRLLVIAKPRKEVIRN